MRPIVEYATVAWSPHTKKGIDCIESVQRGLLTTITAVIVVYHLVWGLTNPTYLKPATNLQKRIVRIITFSEPVSHSEPLLKSLKLMKCCVIIHFEILSFVFYQWFHKMTPSCFSDYFKAISSVYSYSTRQSLNEDLFVNSVQTTQYGIRSLRYTGTNLWNSLSVNIKLITPFSRFRQTIKNSMIDGYNNIINSKVVW